MSLLPVVVYCGSCEAALILNGVCHVEQWVVAFVLDKFCIANSLGGGGVS